MPLPQALIRVPGDYFGRPDSSPARSFLPQGLFLSARFISGLLFFSTGIISAAWIHPQPALFLHRDYFFRPDSSPTCSFSPQGLFLSTRFIPGLLFSSVGIISAGQIHPYKQISSAADAFSAKYPSENVRHWTHTGKEDVKKT